MRPLGALLLILVTPALATSQQQIQFSGRTWTVGGEDVKVENYLGREAVRLRNSGLILPDIQFENGTIEFDVATTGHRSFVGAAFRIDTAMGAYEDFYLRPHNSGREDATQYTPVYGVLSAWQLYPEYNAPVEIPTERWLHVKLVISGSRLDAFIGDVAEPVLVVDDLKLGKSRGVVALKSNFPVAGQPADLYPTAFADFRLTLDDSPGTYKQAAPPAPEVISRWSLSPAFPAPETPIRALPREMIESEGWETVVGESSGLVNLARYRSFPQDAQRATVLARVIINSDREQEKKLNFGFSDEGSIFLNGRCLFSANNTYRSRSFRYLGAVTIDNDAVYLPLRSGANELVVAVTEAFGGWGLVARLEDLDGIRVEHASP